MRAKIGIEAEEVAQILGRERTVISQIETGQRRVDVLEFYAIARALEVSPEELFADLVKKLPHKIQIDR
jgi:transcriptional regulator with XRE-family HTH domain